MNLMAPPTSPEPRAWPARVAAIVLVVLGFIPIVAFVRMGFEIPGLGAQLRDTGARDRC